MTNCKHGPVRGVRDLGATTAWTLLKCDRFWSALLEHKILAQVINGAEIRLPPNLHKITPLLNQHKQQIHFGAALASLASNCSISYHLARKIP